MNRLVIIGNGFDLAHGLPTKYSDFIDDYWKNIKDSNHDELISFNLDNYVSFNGHERLEDVIEMILKLNEKFFSVGIDIYKMNDFSIPMADNRIPILKYNNELFRLINQKSIVNWVDIENVYYKVLKEISSGGKYNNLGDINKLNKEFEQIKNSLSKYLIEKIYKEYKFEHFGGENQDWIEILKILKPISITSNEHNILREFNEEVDQDEIIEKFNEEKTTIFKNQLWFLNFNYTPTIQKYLESLKKGEVNIDNIHIHGELLNDENEINFGFGDEMDESYKVIENKNENEYLRNFKSFQYLQNNNYDKLLSYINSEKYQVIILGHSCGLSDRTLLNTIFEHDNCRSIKPYYYEIKNEEGKVIGDNYTEIIQNISRHFNDKVKMRSKVVNKTLCKPLPQIKLPKK